MMKKATLYRNRAQKLETNQNLNLHLLQSTFLYRKQNCERNTQTGRYGGDRMPLYQFACLVSPLTNTSTSSRRPTGVNKCNRRFRIFEFVTVVSAQQATRHSQAPQTRIVTR